MSACEYDAPTTKPGSLAVCFFGEGSRRPSEVRARQKGDEDLKFPVSELSACSPECTPLEHMILFLVGGIKTYSDLSTQKDGALAFSRTRMGMKRVAFIPEHFGGGLELTNLDHFLRSSYSQLSLSLESKV